MAPELRDCPRCGERATAQVIYERFGSETWWCLRCEYDWNEHNPSLSIGITQRSEAIASLHLHQRRRVA
jgi:ribosomal protein L37AE/L43A